MTNSQIPLPAVDVPFVMEDDQLIAKREYQISCGQIYEVFRVHRGVPQFLEEHIQRMERAANDLGITMPARRNWRETLLSLCAMQSGTQNVKMILDASKEASPRLIAFFIPSRYPTPEQIEDGVIVTIIDGERPLPHLKRSGHAVREASDRILAQGKYFEVLLRNRRDEVTEGSRSSIIFLKGRAIYTPPLSDVLPGITRAMVIRAAMRLGIPINSEPIRSSDLQDFEAAALLGTSPGVLPIRSIVPIEPSILQPIHFDPTNPILKSLRDAYAG